MSTEAQMTSDVATMRQLLDSSPGNVGLAMALADALQEAGAEAGYVALARLDRVPFHYSNGTFGWWVHDSEEPEDCCNQPGWVDRSGLRTFWGGIVRANHLITRELAEHAAAEAFMRLPTRRRAALLAGEWE